MKFFGFGRKKDDTVSFVDKNNMCLQDSDLFTLKKSIQNKESKFFSFCQVSDDRVVFGGDDNTYGTLQVWNCHDWKPVTQVWKILRNEIGIIHEWDEERVLFYCPYKGTGFFMCWIYSGKFEEVSEEQIKSTVTWGMQIHNRRAVCTVADKKEIAFIAKRKPEIVVYDVEKKKEIGRVKVDPSIIEITFNKTIGLLMGLLGSGSVVLLDTTTCELKKKIDFHTNTTIYSSTKYSAASFHKNSVVFFSENNDFRTVVFDHTHPKGATPQEVVQTTMNSLSAENSELFRLYSSFCDNIPMFNIVHDVFFVIVRTKLLDGMDGYRILHHDCRRKKSGMIPIHSEGLGKEQKKTLPGSSSFVEALVHDCFRALNQHNAFVILRNGDVAVFSSDDVWTCHVFSSQVLRSRIKNSSHDLFFKLLERSQRRGKFVDLFISTQ